MIIKILVGTGILLSVALLSVALLSLLESKLKQISVALSFLEFRLKQLASLEFAQKVMVVLVTMLFLCLAYNIGDVLI